MLSPGQVFKHRLDSASLFVDFEGIACLKEIASFDALLINLEEVSVFCHVTSLGK